MLIVKDQSPATLVATSMLGLSILLFSGASAAAAEPAARAALVSESIQIAPFAGVLLVTDGVEAGFKTHARTVAEFLQERDVKPAADDYLSAPLEAPIVDGMELAWRRAVAVTLDLHGERRIVRSAEATVGDLLKQQNITLGANDVVSPQIDSAPHEDSLISVRSVRTWTASVQEHVSAKTKHRPDMELARGETRTVDKGRPGIRRVTFRYVERDGQPAVRTMLASRILRAPRPRIVAAGVATYAALAGYAKQGFESAVRIAGAALHMIATAYTAGCYQCSGITKLGMHAGHGIVAVDPRVIPLGSKLFVPGYGRAIAGDTGGAIQGHRIDLGFDSNGAALRFGRRAVTVYLLH